MLTSLYGNAGIIYRGFIHSRFLWPRVIKVWFCGRSFAWTLNNLSIYALQKRLASPYQIEITYLNFPMYIKIGSEINSREPCRNIR